jgi:hypothetical protein
VVLASTLVVAAAMLAPLAQGVASATTAATATIGAGTLSVSVPANIAFSDTLSGVDQTVTAVLAIDVKDATGSGAGWDLQATSTQFTTGGNTLPTNSVTIATAPSSPTCDTGATCTLASNGVSYPYVLPAGVTAPPASKFFDAAASTGMGDQTVTPTFSLAVPANTLGGTYNSTWTISVVSGP